MTYQSMTDVAYNCLSKRKRSVEFAKLWQEVNSVMGFPEAQKVKKMAQFYSELMLDNRFASLKENKWDLKNRHTFEETHIDVDKILVDDDDDDADESSEDELEELETMTNNDDE